MPMEQIMRNKYYSTCLLSASPLHTMKDGINSETVASETLISRFLVVYSSCKPQPSVRIHFHRVYLRPKLTKIVHRVIVACFGIRVASKPQQ
jgi:hypothetical protein